MANRPIDRIKAGERLEEARKALGLTQSELAKIVKKNHRTIVRWEAGEAAPSEGDWTLMASHLRVSPLWLMTGAGPRELDQLFDPLFARLNPDGSTTNLYPVEETGPRLTPSQKILQNVMLDLDASKLTDDEATKLTLAIQEALRRARS